MPPAFFTRNNNPSQSRTGFLGGFNEPRGQRSSHMQNQVPLLNQGQNPQLSGFFRSNNNSMPNRQLRPQPQMPAQQPPPFNQSQIPIPQPQMLNQPQIPSPQPQAHPQSPRQNDLQTPQAQQAIKEAGITFEPINPELLKKLQDNAAAEDAILAEKVPIPAPKNEIPSENLPLYLGELAQNERNGSIYYEYLSQQAKTDGQRNLLNEITRGCNSRSHDYAGLYAKHSLDGSAYSIKPAEIQRPRSFRSGLSYAIYEEARTLRSLSAAYDEAIQAAQDSKTTKKLQSIITAKLIDLTILQSINHI